MSFGWYIPLFKKVNRRLGILDFSRRARTARVLSYVLLFLFAYGTTRDAIHSHRNLPQSTPSATSGFLTGAGSPSQTRGSTQSGECLVCQFQQNLSSAELFTPLLVLAPAPSPSFSSVPAVSFCSPSRSTGHGRA